MSYRILKRVEIVPESELQRLDNFVTAEEKGYPSVISPLKIVAEFDDETNKLKGYTSFKDLGKFHFVGNGYVYDREGGVYRKVLDFRDNFLGSSKPKVTLLNPIEGTNLARLSAMVEKRGGVKIEKYSQVDDIMSESMYNEMKKLPMYRYPPYKKEVKKWQEVLKKKKEKSSRQKDPECYDKVKAKYTEDDGTWPSAYGSGALVQCRKVGAANWGKKK
jgi:hypothetical protein